MVTSIRKHFNVVGSDEASPFVKTITDIQNLFNVVLIGNCLPEHGHIPQPGEIVFNTMRYRT